jgi:hypothetical protein
MNDHIKRYKKWIEEGFSPLEAFGIVASGIAVGGTFEDLKLLDREFMKDLGR